MGFVVNKFGGRIGFRLPAHFRLTAVCANSPPGLKKSYGLVDLKDILSFVYKDHNAAGISSG